MSSKQVIFTTGLTLLIALYSSGCNNPPQTTGTTDTAKTIETVKQPVGPGPDEGEDPKVGVGQTVLTLKQGDSELIFNLNLIQSGMTTKAAPYGVEKVSADLSVDGKIYPVSIPGDKFVNNKHAVSLRGLKKGSAIDLTAKAFDNKNQEIGQATQQEKVTEDIKTVDVNISIKIEMKQEQTTNVDSQQTSNQNTNITGPTININVPAGQPLTSPGIQPSPTALSSPNPNPTITPSAGQTASPIPTATATPSPTPTPQPPTGLNKSDITQNSFTLTWTTVTDATGYKIYKDSNLYADNVTGTSKSITGLTPSTTYNMQVSAVNTGGESIKSTGLSVTTSANMGKIVFVAERDGNREIYTMDTNGNNQTNLTNNAADDNTPSCSPDGTKIAFLSNRDGGMYELYVMNSNGSNVTKITNNSNNQISFSRAGWSSDGTKIAFTSNKEGAWAIYTMDTNGANQTRIGDLGDNREPVWSPDGSKIAFHSSRQDAKYEIYSMSSSGANITRLTYTTGGWAIRQAWAPNNKIIFYANGTGKQQIYSINGDGSNVTRITNNSFNDTFPFWSPDGSKIVFVSDRDGNNEIYIMDANGSNQSRLTSNSSEDWCVNWAL